MKTSFFDKKQEEKSASPVSGLEALIRYPQAELYRLIVDGSMHKKENGWLGYEGREPGSLKAALKGLSVAISTLEEKEVTVDLIKKIHAACTQDVKKINATPGQFRPKNSYASFPLSSSLATKEGLEQLLNNIEQQSGYEQNTGAWFGPVPSSDNAQPILPIDITKAITWNNIEQRRKDYKAENNAELAKIILNEMKDKNITYRCVAPSEKYVLTKMEKITDSYNTWIQTAETQDHRLRIIVDHIQQYEQLHPFKDANNRTFVNALLNRLLTQNGFAPATFEEPNIFDGHSVDELVEKVKIAINNTHDIIKGKQLFGFNTETMSQDKKHEFAAIVADFVKDLNKIQQAQISASSAPKKVI